MWSFFFLFSPVVLSILYLFQLTFYFKQRTKKPGREATSALPSARNDHCFGISLSRWPVCFSFCLFVFLNTYISDSLLLSSITPEFSITLEWKSPMNFTVFNVETSDWTAAFGCRHSQTFPGVCRGNVALKSHPVWFVFPRHRLVVVHAHMWRLRIIGVEVCYTAGLLRWPPKADVSSIKSIYLCCMDQSAPTSYFLKRQKHRKRQPLLCWCCRGQKTISFNLAVKCPNL